MPRTPKPGHTIRRAKALRRALTPPEILLWRYLKGSPGGLRFRKQHPAGDYILDFFCARANLAVEVDGSVHDCDEIAARDATRDAWLRDCRIDTLRVPAGNVLRDPQGVAQAVVTLAEARLAGFRMSPPSALRAATSPSQVDGEEIGVDP